jgi:threonine dehydrogenase-like Zn-dependent dehydrogenase
MARTGRAVAVVGSGPAGLAAAQQLTRVGHEVVVFERADRIGGLLRYGIPDFKLEKPRLDRRLGQMRSEGTIFRAAIEVGVDYTVDRLRSRFDAIILAGGAPVPRDLPVAGRDLRGIHLAMEYLTWANTPSRCGGGFNVAVTTSASSTRRGRPDRLRSSRAASPPSAYRSRQWITVGRLTPTRVAISVFE